MSKVSWDFFIRDYPPSFVSKELQSIQTKYLRMDVLLEEVKTGKIKGISSDGAGVGFGVRQKCSRPQDLHKGEREAMLCVLGEMVKTNRL